MTVQLTGGRWIVDVGLGDMPHAPILLTWGRWPQGELSYEVRPALAAPGGWRLQQDPRASYAGVEVDPRSLPDLRSPVRIVNPKARELRRWVTKDPDRWMLKGVRHEALSDGRGGCRHSGPVDGCEGEYNERTRRLAAAAAARR